MTKVSFSFDKHIPIELGGVLFVVRKEGAVQEAVGGFAVLKSGIC